MLLTWKAGLLKELLSKRKKGTHQGQTAGNGLCYKREDAVDKKKEPDRPGTEGGKDNDEDGQKVSNQMAACFEMYRGEEKRRQDLRDIQLLAAEMYVFYYQVKYKQELKLRKNGTVGLHTCYGDMNTFSEQILSLICLNESNVRFTFAQLDIKPLNCIA